MKTTNLQVPRRWLDLPVPATITSCIFALLAIAALFGRIHTGPQVAAQQTPALDPIIIIATSPAAVVPTAVPIQVAAVLPRFVMCYDQPVNGTVLGPIPDPGAAAIVARYGAGWVMTPWNGGYCWLRAADVGLPDVADLQPTEAPAVIYQVVNQPVVETIQEATSAPEPTPVQ